MNPLKNYVLVTQQEAETKTASGIVLTGSSVDVGARPGRVDAVGPDVNKHEIKVGDKVALIWEKSLRIDTNRVLVSDEFILGVY